jgi:hypothetical protein
VASPNRPVNQMRGHAPKKLLTTVDRGRRIVAFPRKERITQKAKQPQLEKLIKSLSLLISEMLALEASGLIDAPELHPDHRASARNLMDYLALRRHDIRHLQSQLAALGLSSLGRTEPHVLSSLHAVLNILLKLAGSVPISPAPKAAPKVGLENRLLDRNTEALFGKAPTDRHVRIMVTMPPEAATKVRTGSRPSRPGHGLHADQLRP